VYDTGGVRRPVALVALVLTGTLSSVASVTHAPAPIGGEVVLWAWQRSPGTRQSWRGLRATAAAGTAFPA